MTLDLTLFIESLLVVIFSILGAFTRELFVKEEEKEERWKSILLTGIVSGGLVFLAYGFLIPKKAIDERGLAFIAFTSGLIGFQVLLVLLRKPSGVIRLGGPALKPLADEMEKEEKAHEAEEKKAQASEPKKK